MSEGFDSDWSATVCSALDELFVAASAGFSRSIPQQGVYGPPGDMLWEADPQRFAQRYPDSGIQESYWGWPQPCIDYWVYVDEPTRLALISTEGWTGGRHEIPLTGRGVEDARRISEVLGAILRVGP